MVDKKTIRGKIDPRLLKLIRQIRYSAAGFYFLGFLIPIVSYLSLEIGGIELGFVVSLQTIGFTISSLFAGFLSNNRTLRAKLIFMASIGRFISYLLLYFSFLYTLYWMMALGTFILGFGAGFFWTPFGATVADATEYEYRSEAFGIFSQQSGIGGFIGATIGFTVIGFVEVVGNTAAIAFSPLILYGIANIYAGIRVLQLAPRIEYVDIEEKAAISKITQRKIIYSFIFLLFILFIEYFIGALVGPFIQYFLLENITQEIMFIMLAYAPGSILSIIFAPRIGRIADKLNPRYTLSIASVLGAIMTWLLINSTKIWQFSLIFIVDSSVVATAGLTLTKIISTVSRERRGTVFGFHDASSNLGHIAGPLIGGILWDELGNRAPFILSIIIEGCLALLYPIAIIILSHNVNVREKISEEISDELET